jgi:prevent-host-death family protein
MSLSTLSTRRFDLVHFLVYFVLMAKTPTQVNIHEAKTHFSRLVRRAASGEEIVIARSGKPQAKMVAFARSMAPRKPGSAKGQMVIHLTFDAPLPKRLLAEFER